MTNFNYKKYSLEHLENWMHDAMSAGEATPQEIYDVIVGVVKENYYCYKHQTSQAYELLALLNGNGQSYEDVIKEKEYYEPSMPPWGHSDLEYAIHHKESLSCDKDDPSSECKGAWNDFWESKQDKVNKWVLPVEECKDADTDETEYFVSFPDDLLDAANLKEGDKVEWVDNKNGTYTLRKVTKPLGIDEC
jgi:hypothetical protein